MGSGDGLGGCHACIKYLMFAFNFIFWLVGCALVGVGIWVMVDDGFQKLSDDSSFVFLKYAGIVLIVVGSVVMVVGFFGCCGAIRESQCLLVMFFICMLVLFLALVAAGVACLVFKDEVLDTFKKTFEKQVKEWKEKPSDNSIIHIVQKFFECCGTTNSLVYGLTPPDSCDASFYTKGCNDAVPKKLESHIALAAGIALGAGAVMLLGMIFSMLLCCAIRDVE